MKKRTAVRALWMVLPLLSVAVLSHAQEWVSLSSKGKLQYDTTSRGDRIMDFSYAGYKGGGVNIPDVPVRIRVRPDNANDAATIQAAIDSVSALPLVKGFRGAVLLAAGAYTCDKTILLHTSGVVLQGSGSNPKGTVLQLTGPAHVAVALRGKPVYTKTSAAAKVTMAYVPAGTNKLTVDQPAIFNQGDTIRITKPVTPEWIQFMGMHDLVRDGKPQTWINGELTTDRIITAINGNTLSLDVPLTDSYDAQYTSAVVERISTSGEIVNCGIGGFSIVSPTQTGTINDRHHQAFHISGITDAWAEDIQAYNTINSVSVTGRRITLDRIRIYHDTVTTGAAKPADINASGPQLLVQRCYIKGSNVFYIATGAKVTGPIVILNCTFEGGGWIQPHQRWATGVLVDNCHVPGGGIEYMNRGSMGSGHGWSIGWSVVWNSTAKSFLNQQPPGSMNWMIGCIGEQRQEARPFGKFPMLPGGINVSQGKHVQPESLYYAQLQERLKKKI
ncbi:hypothetical protein SAMN05444266_111192 [Chitinophaga jiangningensis]|uniref:Pectate lyase superfamily protein n=1 Tax=Chitinophaga jiangningensis TaxID=1419482 RepID=A0A1M7LWU7_9BACT|nr:hypothetical protein [Chitinophaga jiangningensis]SHM82737.1 hypothetical protein SAMN05444266_111192 [Chitinophaga jiangningensis]